MIRIDVSAALHQRAGVGRYTRELARSLWATVSEGQRDRLGFFTTGGHRMAPDLPPASLRTSHLSPRLWRASLLVGHLLKRRIAPGLDGEMAFHATDVAYPWARPGEVLVTVHDLSVLRHPNFHTPGNRYFQSLMLRGLRRSGHRVLAVSHFTARELTSLLSIEQDRITVSHPGVAPVFRGARTPSQIRAVREKYALFRPFILTVATHEPRKNLGALLRIFQRDAFKTHDLVLVGQPGWGGSAIDYALWRAPGVRVLGYVPDEDLACLYSDSSVFVYPALYEGFGSPVAEAMACGAAVVCSSACGVVELATDAVVTVDPKDSASLEAAVFNLMESDTTTLRNRARVTGAHLTYEDCARTTLTEYVRSFTRPLDGSQSASASL